MMMGMWFISSFVGNYLAGYIGTYWTKMGKPSFFLLLTALAFLSGLSMLAVMVPLKKALGDENAPTGPGEVGPDASSGDADEHRTVRESGAPPKGDAKEESGAPKGSAA
jgi:hypothetical protein